MINRFKYILVPAALSAALAACGGGGGLSASDALNQNLDLICAKAYECMDSFPTGGGVTFEQFFGTSEANCPDTYGALLGIDDLLASVEAGRVAYNEADAQVCLDGIDPSSLTCDQFWNGGGPDAPPECDTAFAGTVATGDACTIDDDCAADTDICDETTHVCTAG